MQSRSRWRYHIIYPAILAFLAWLMWWPLPARVTTHVPGTPTWAFDESTFLWNTWYFQYALVHLHTSPLYTDLIWHPLGIALILYTYDVFNALLAAPLLWATGNLPLASNTVLVLHTVLSGYGTFLLVGYLLRRERGGSALLAAAVAGLAYAFASNRAVYAAQGHYDMVSTGAIPFFALYFIRTLDRLGQGEVRRAYRDGGMAGLFFAFAALAEMIFAVFLTLFALVTLLTYAPHGEGWRQRWRAYARGIGPLGLMVLVAVGVWSPLLIPILREMLTGHYILKGWGESIKLSVDVLGFLTPTALHPLWGRDWAHALRLVEEGRGRFSDINTVFLGYVTLGLALVGWLVNRARTRTWAWNAGIFALLSLGPFLHVGGRWQFDLDGVKTAVPLPFVLLHYLPFVRGNRAPNRNSVILMLALAVLAGYGTLWVLRRVRGRTRAGVAVALAALILFEHAALPLPLSDARIPPVYDLIAEEDGPFALLQVPLGWRNSFGVFGVERTQIQYYQTRHGKPMLGGNISRAPEFKMAYFRRIPLFRALAQVEFGAEPKAEVLERARRQAPELMRLYNVRYVILFPPIPGRHPYVDTWQRTWAFVKDILPLEREPFWQGAGIEAYRVVQPPAPVATFADLGEEGSEPYRGEGWYENEVIQGRSAVWAGKDGRSARLFLRADGSDPYLLTLRILPFTYPGSPRQRISLKVNDTWVLRDHPLQEGWQEVRVRVPAGTLRDHTNTITLEAAWRRRPRDVFPGQWEIGKTGVRLPVDVELTAFEDGAYMSTIDDQGRRRDVSFGRRGYNVTVLDPKTGRVLQKAGFDTYANRYEAERLAAFIDALPPGVIVLVATRGDAGRHLTDEAVAALRSVGSAVDLRRHPHAFHALVGVKGAKPGTAVEVVDARSAYVRLGGYPDFRTLSVAVDWVGWEPLQRTTGKVVPSRAFVPASTTRSSK